MYLGYRSDGRRLSRKNVRAAQHPSTAPRFDPTLSLVPSSYHFLLLFFPTPAWLVFIFIDNIVTILIHYNYISYLGIGLCRIGYLLIGLINATEFVAPVYVNWMADKPTVSYVVN